MRLINSNGLDYLQFPALMKLPGFFHGVLLRRTTAGGQPRMDFNLGMNTGTPDAEIWQNRGRMLGCFGSDYQGVYARQNHGKTVGIVRKKDHPKFGKSTRSLQLKGDAMITDVGGCALVIQVADCQPIVVVDPVKRVVANIHSGWRGSIQNIIGTTIHRMQSDFQCLPEDLICGIGPSLGPCCAEFINYQDEIPETFWKYRRSADHFDFWQASVDQLSETGVRYDRITVSGLCTRCNPHLFFSYRAQRKTGRFASVVGIRFGEGSGV